METAEASSTTAEAATSTATTILDDIVALATFLPIHIVSPRPGGERGRTLLRGSLLPQAPVQSR
jgi:hypothetical protein